MHSMHAAVAPGALRTQAQAAQGSTEQAAGLPSGCQQATQLVPSPRSLLQARQHGAAEQEGPHKQRQHGGLSRGAAQQGGVHAAHVGSQRLRHAPVPLILLCRGRGHKGSEAAAWGGASGAAAHAASLPATPHLQAQPSGLACEARHPAASAPGCGPPYACPYAASTSPSATSAPAPPAPPYSTS